MAAYLFVRDRANVAWTSVVESYSLGVLKAPDQVKESYRLMYADAWRLDAVSQDDMTARARCSTIART